MSGETLKAVLELENALARELTDEQQRAEDALVAKSAETERLLALEEEALERQTASALVEAQRRAEQDAECVLRQAAALVARLNALTDDDLAARLLPALQALWPGEGS